MSEYSFVSVDTLLNTYDKHVTDYINKKDLALLKQLDVTLEPNEDNTIYTLYKGRDEEKIKLGEIDANSAVQEIADDLKTHTENTEIHITEEERQKWNKTQSTYSAGDGIQISEDNQISTETRIIDISAGDYEKLSEELKNDPCVYYHIFDKEDIVLNTSTSVIDGLDSTSSTDVLSANQGRVLKEMIENAGTGDGDMLESKYVLEGGDGQVLSAKSSDKVGEADTSVLEKLSDEDGTLLYNGEPITSDSEGVSFTRFTYAEWMALTDEERLSYAGQYVIISDDINVHPGSGCIPFTLAEWNALTEEQRKDLAGKTVAILDDHTVAEPIDFESSDVKNPTSYEEIELVEDNEKPRTLFNKLSLAIKNIRYIMSIIGNTDLKGKTITEAISTKAEIDDIPTTLPASDVKAWAKADNKPSYTASEVGAVANTQDGINGVINQLSTGDSTPVDTDYFISQYVGGSQNTYHRRPLSKLWQYIQGKIDAAGYAKTTNVVEKTFSNHYYSNTSSKITFPISGAQRYLLMYTGMGSSGINGFAPGISILEIAWSGTNHRLSTMAGTNQISAVEIANSNITLSFTGAYVSLGVYRFN